MKEKIVERLLKLLCVKSIATLMATTVFCIMSLRGWLSEAQFMAVYTTIMAFYFGTQKAKNEVEK